MHFANDVARAFMGLSLLLLAFLTVQTATRAQGKIDQQVALLGHAEWSVRMQAAEMLGSLGNKRTVTPLIEALNDRHEDVRAAAKTALSVSRLAAETGQITRMGLNACP